MLASGAATSTDAGRNERDDEWNSCRSMPSASARHRGPWASEAAPVQVTEAAAEDVAWLSAMCVRAWLLELRARVCVC